jgi:hypothetical protein
MSLSVTGSSAMGKTMVIATNNRAKNPEEFARLAINRFIHIVDDVAMPEVRAQGYAFKQEIFDLLLYYLTQMADAERRTIVTRLRNGSNTAFQDVAKLIETRAI